MTRERDYDDYSKHGEMYDYSKSSHHPDNYGKNHSYRFGHPSHYIDSTDEKEKPETIYSFVREWIVDDEGQEFLGAVLNPEDFSMTFKFTIHGKIYSVRVPAKQFLVWERNDKRFRVGTFTVKPYPKVNLTFLIFNGEGVLGYSKKYGDDNGSEKKEGTDKATEKH